jgi:hypothetical protein
MKGDLEDQVNIAIEFFPGRVKRDQWVMQAKELLRSEIRQTTAEDKIPLSVI